MAETSPVCVDVLPPVPDAPRRVYGKHCREPLSLSIEPIKFVQAVRRTWSSDQTALSLLIWGWDVESNKSGRLWHVSSQPEMIPSSRLMLSCDKRLPLDTRMVSIWITGKRFWKSIFYVWVTERLFSKNLKLTQCKETVKQTLKQKGTKTSHTSEDGQNCGTIPMPTFATRPLTTSSQQISGLQLDRFPDPSSFLE